MKITKEIDKLGTVSYFDKDGKRHQEGGPAVIFKDGTKKWFRHGDLHRVGEPAVEFASGEKIWYHSGQKIKWSKK